MNIEHYKTKLSTLRVNRAGGPSLHKPCLILAAIDLIEAGGAETNQIHYRPELIERFNDYFEVARRDRDHPNVYMPYFHLKSDGFWHLEPLAGKETALESMATAVKHGDITENVACAKLDADLHEILQTENGRAQLRATLISHWFPEHTDQIWAIVRRHQKENREEAQLRVPGRQHEVRDSETPARSAAFRRLVLQAYDYRCAATGWRIIMPGGASLIEAAHIVPFSESHNDDPRNGIALTPTFHVALDRNWIAPGPDMKWHVSSMFDKRIPDNKPFVELAGQPVLYYGDRQFRPSKHFLEKRANMLME